MTNFRRHTTSKTLEYGRRAIFLDRDGVLNEPIVRGGKPYPPADIGQLKIYNDASAACAALKQAGFVLIVVTNQPDVARGTQTRQIVANINAALSRGIPIDDFRVCYHDNADDCNCRKPKPGLLEEAARKWDVTLSKSFMIGDRWRDVDAGKAAGCKTIFIDRNYREHLVALPDFTANSLGEAAEWILQQQQEVLI